jgi:type III secretion protein W
VGLGPNALPTGAPEAAEIAAQQIAKEKEVAVAVAEVAQAETTADDLLFIYEEVSNPLAGKFAADQKNIKERPPLNLYQLEKAEEKFKVIPDRDVKDEASKFERRNSELKAPILLLLLEKIKGCHDKDELLQILAQFYPDPSLADEALDFLLATTLGTLREIVQEAKEELLKSRGREIQAGRNINEEVQRYVKLGLGAPSKLRDLYRDITGNPRDPIALFLELGDRFNYKEMRKVLAYLFHALGSDLKSSGPSIQPGLLHTLLSEVRNLQAGLGILHFFRNRMRLIAFLFERNDLPLPQQLTFETIARQFVTLLQERYPSAERVLQLATKLGIAEQILAKIIVFSQMRDAIREIALYHFYRSVQHRDELYKAILDALEQLEEELDELLEGEYEEEDAPDKKKKQKQEEENEE